MPGKYAIILLVLGALAACESYLPKKPETLKVHQVVLFHHSFVNYAWGYQNRGWFIDNDGYMKAYFVRSPQQWAQIESSGPDSGYISRDSLLNNYFQATRVISKISLDTVFNMYLKINQASYGYITPRKRSAFDAGRVDFACYFWDEMRGKFKYVILSESGDFSQTNLDPSAKELDAWLKGLNQIYVDSLSAEQ